MTELRDLPLPPSASYIQDWIQEEEIKTECGIHLESERLYRRDCRHGNVDIGALEKLPSDLLTPISNGEIGSFSPRQWAFLDTETTGLAGGSGTYAFLVGIGRITQQGFCVRHFFMREPGEEASLLTALSEHLRQFEVIVTFNGKAYDQPLLEARYRLARLRPPFGRLAHLDLLFGARRLWKLRFESCRLTTLENQVLGVEREGDVSGKLIPDLYFEYLRNRDIFRLAAVFHHNAVDILTVACLIAIISQAFYSPERTDFFCGTELVGLGRWLRQVEQPENALRCFRGAIDRGLPDHLLFSTLWDIAKLEKKFEPNTSIASFTELASSQNQFRAAALEELAKHYEHRKRDYVSALQIAKRAQEMEDTPGWQHRTARLERRLRRQTSPCNAALSTPLFR